MGGDLLTFKLGFKFDDEDWISPLTDFDECSDLVTFISIENVKKQINDGISSVDTLVDLLMDSHLEKLKDELKYILKRKLKGTA